MSKRLKINRRKFIQGSGAGLTGLALVPHLEVFAGAQSAPKPIWEPVPLNHNWLFSEKNLPNATQAAFNDAGFKSVTIPHTNKMLPWHGFDDKEYEFVSIYRRHFKLP
ncbi:MAG TPA: hypothetical protein VE961_00230, partial [Pyrinomonadaceae bacterium]|nr:hypothetical protein [Pyrinomonadaceae bacterium]